MSRILCVEDEPALRRVLVEELALAGYETVEAVNGIDGLTAILESKPDLVLCDITMPKMNGHDLLKNLRLGHPEYAELPFVFLSALADKADVISGQKIGADDYLTKPVDLDILLSTVDSRLKQVSRMRELRQSEMESLRSQIIATMPHEFRTPLNAILGYAEMIKGQMLGPIGNEAYVEYAENIYEGGQRLHDTVEKILAISEMSCGQVTADAMPFDLVEVIDSTVRFVQTRFASETPRIQFDPAMTSLNLPAGQNLLAQALREVIDNACKFTPVEGHVEITVEEVDKFAVITVIDSGVGIESEVLKTISSAFIQGESGSTRSYEGLGLGLTLAEKSVSMIGGSIQFESAYRNGTRVIICAPLGDVADAAPALS